VRDGTLQNALLHRFPQTAQVPRAGIVHRLDKDTSGVLVVALNLSAQARLVAAMARREIRREYVALARGLLAAGGTVDAPLDRHPRDRLKRAVVASGRPAVTHYRIAERFAHHTLLDVQLETGRTHQIRVHLAHLRHPLVGDPLSGSHARVGGGLSAALRAAIANFQRQALHARRLSFAHPRLGTPLSFESPLPADFAALLALLRLEDRA
jgi:23S rRNA pseudouridine1911/1915/1917 synthase